MASKVALDSSLTMIQVQNIHFLTWIFLTTSVNAVKTVFYRIDLSRRSTMFKTRKETMQWNTVKRTRKGLEIVFG